MPDLRTPERILIAAQDRQAARRQPTPDRSWPPSALHDPNHKPRVRVPERRPTLDLTRPPAQHQAPNDTLVARGPLKIVAALDPGALLNIAVHDDKSRVVLTIKLPDRTVTASISAKSARRAIAAVREHGAENVAAIVQGKLVGTEIAEAGLVVQVKTPRPAEKET